MFKKRKKFMKLKSKINIKKKKLKSKGRNLKCINKFFFKFQINENF